MRFRIENNHEFAALDSVRSHLQIKFLSILKLVIDEFFYAKDKFLISFLVPSAYTMFV